MSLPIGWSALAAVAGLTGVLIWRVREGRTAVTIRENYYSAIWYGNRVFHVPGTGLSSASHYGPWWLFWQGQFCWPIPLLATSRLQREGDAIMMKRSGAFFAVVVVLAIVRYAARGYLDSIMSVDQTAGLFFVLAFGMILRWRMSMLIEFRALTTCTAE